MAKFNKNLGNVSAKYESGGKGVDFVSNGRKWNDPGGDSYGIHQLSGAYSMGAFLRSSYGAKWRDDFAGLKPNTNAFNKVYKKVAGANKTQMAEDQKNFYASTHYVPVRDHAKKKGFDISDRGVQEALFSISVQHGKAKLIVTRATNPANGPAGQVRRLFKERTKYVNGLKTLSSKIKRNITQNRYKNEIKDCLALVGTHSEAKETKTSVETNNQTPDLLSRIITEFGVTLGGLSEMIADATENIINPAAEAATEVLETAQKVIEGPKTIPWMRTATNLIGTKEIVGNRHNQKILRWAKDIGGFVASYYKTDEIPWCGLFVAHCMHANGIKIGFKNPLGARNWNKFGYKVTPQRGAIMVFSRKGGGHVGFYVSEDSKYYHILGGNQSNRVDVTKVAKNRFLGARWPSNYPTLQKQHAGRVVKKFDGTVSTNEA